MIDRNINLEITEAILFFELNEKYYQNFSFSTLILSAITFSIIFYLYAQKKINLFHVFMLILSALSVFVVNFFNGDLAYMHLNTDQYNYVYGFNYSRSTSMLNFFENLSKQNKYNYATVFSLLPFPTVESLIDLSLINKILFLIVIVMVSHSANHNNLFLNLLILIPLFHYHTSFPLKDGTLFFLSFFWIFLLEKKKIFS